jgi:hypothetical protein
MLSYSEWLAQQNSNPAPNSAPTAPQSRPVAAAQPMAPANAPAQNAQGGVLDLPEFNYTMSDDLTGQNAGAYLNDYYNYIGNDYGSLISQFSTDNAGQMVNWDEDQFMTINDFGLNSSRKSGELRDKLPTGYFLGDEWYSNNDPLDTYYYYDHKGRLQSLAPNEINPFFHFNGDGPADGTELYRAVEKPVEQPNPLGVGGYEIPPEYVSAGNYRKETEAEAWERMLANGGSYSDDPFGGDDTFTGLYTDNTHKKYGGQDTVNIPELEKLINDPNWVVRDDNGNITQVRAELLPYIFGQELHQQGIELHRGATPRSNGAFNLAKNLFLGLFTGGLGIAGAAGLGLTTAGTASGMAGAMLPAGTALSTGGMVLSSGLGAGLHTAINGGDLGDFAKNFAMGSIGGYAGSKLSPVLSKAVGNNTIGNALSGGLTRGGLNAVSGGDFGTGFIQGGLNSLVNGTMRNTVSPFLGDLGLNQSFADWLSSSAGKYWLTQYSKKRRYN